LFAEKGMAQKTYGPWSTKCQKGNGYLNPLVKEKYKQNKSYGHKNEVPESKKAILRHKGHLRV